MSGRPIRTARHEAAHAVVAQHLGWPVKGVVMHGDRGHCEHGRSRKPCPFEYALISLAGTAAERKWHRLPWKAMSAEDARAVYGMGFGERAVATLAMHAQAMVEELAPQIEAVAQALKKGDLTGREVRKIMAGVPR